MAPPHVDTAAPTEVVGSVTAFQRAPRQAPACLVQIYPANTCIGRRHLLDQPLTFGRDPACDVPLDDASVSRQHSRVVQKGSSYFVADLRSTNGTFVNDTAVTVRPLADGDYLRIGNHIFRFLSGGNIEADFLEEIYRLTITDALTGAHNKRHLLDFLERELLRSQRHHRALALVMLDIDHFKAINDSQGHLAGDAVLRGLAARLRQEIRRDELFARYGGEEFAVVLPETSADGAAVLAERLRALVASAPIDDGQHQFPITVSLGVAATAGTETMSPSAFIGQADAKLYQAKADGRNRVAI